MWPNITNEIITFFFTPHTRAAALFKPTTGSKQFALLALDIDVAIDTARQHNIEHSPEQFKLFTQSFIKKNRAEGAFVVYALSHHGITEELVQYHTSNPKKTELYDPKFRNNQWFFRYLCPSNDGQFMFYRVGIPRSLLFQYQLLAAACFHNVIRLTTQFESHFAVYKYIRGSAFRQSQLAYDLERHDYQLGLLLDPNILHRLVHIPDHTYQRVSEHTMSVATLFGVYLETYLCDIRGKMR